MDLWKRKRSATVATVTSAKIHAAIVPMKQRAKGADCNLVKSAGPSRLFGNQSPLKCFCRTGLKTFFFFLICDCYAPVPAKGHVAQNHVRLKAQAKSADLTLTVPKRACAMEPLLCVLPRNQRKTSPPAILIPKFASAGYVRIVPFLLYYIWFALYLSRRIYHATFFNCRYVLVQFVRSTIWKYAPVAPKTAKMRLQSCVTCAAWRKVSKSQESIRLHTMWPE